MDGSAIKVVAHFAPQRSDPMRDDAHRRVAGQVNEKFSLLDLDIDALKKALESLGATVELPSRGGR